MAIQKNKNLTRVIGTKYSLSLRKNKLLQMNNSRDEGQRSKRKIRAKKKNARLHQIFLVLNKEEFLPRII